ncbi:unnamed protein product [Caenorhabditis auriculariae]|uniref:Uncharacterized protein n=1 Tax=Caenorhabditis auriculariae TaxID=2777116 RepID=A0A8S1HTX6_9PELO|nr:unnamed protein product [Caenorhabditis auriculariae]
MIEPPYKKVSTETPVISLKIQHQLLQQFPSVRIQANLYINGYWRLFHQINRPWRSSFSKALLNQGSDIEEPPGKSTISVIGWNCALLEEFPKLEKRRLRKRARRKVERQRASKTSQPTTSASGKRTSAKEDTAVSRTLILIYKYDFD